MTGPPEPTIHRIVLLVIVALVLLAAAVVLGLADEVREDSLVVRADRRIVDAVTQHREDASTDVARAVTTLGSAVVIVPVTVVVTLVLLLRHRWRDAAFLAASVTGVALLVWLGKEVIGRSRPDPLGRLVAASGSSFPSGHSANAAACYGALAVILAMSATSPRVRIAAIIAGIAIPFAVGVSRVYLGVHWPSDVVSGWLIAGGWVLALCGLRLLTSSRRGAAVLSRRLEHGP